ncbi:MAG TPA: ATP-binding protein [Propionibacteriaceae bacterium]|nr:ATP-binding protein [Propionibacteriaceae bacterium]HPZ51014.1 ATP-binding protein [Propionibacteriaceae bacterium]
MGTLEWLVVAALAAGLAGMTALWLRSRSRLVAALAETEQLRDLLKRKVERPNVFSHEVRTPLTLIKGAAELLAEESPGPLNPQQRHFLQTISVNAEQVISLAEDMLVEAKIESQLFELRLERVDLKALVRQTVKDARRLHHSTITMADQPGPVILTADRGLLGQAVWNLVNNACRHAGEAARISVSVTTSEGHAIVSVADDGEGMSATERRSLFDAFSVGENHQGTGLGMMITERIVAQHRGRMLVDSVEGRGTTVFFTLPLGPVEVPDA